MKINNLMIIGAAAVGLYLLTKNSKKTAAYDPLAPVYIDGQRVIKPLSELNPNGGGSIFEQFPVR